MTSLTSLVEKPLGRNFIIFHPSDFSPASEIAFGHARYGRFDRILSA